MPALDTVTEQVNYLYYLLTHPGITVTTRANLCSNCRSMYFVNRWPIGTDLDTDLASSRWQVFVQMNDMIHLHLNQSLSK